MDYIGSAKIFRHRIKYKTSNMLDITSDIDSSELISTFYGLLLLLSAFNHPICPSIFAEIIMILSTVIKCLPSRPRLKVEVTVSRQPF